MPSFSAGDRAVLGAPQGNNSIQQTCRRASLSGGGDSGIPASWQRGERVHGERLREEELVPPTHVSTMRNSL